VDVSAGGYVVINGKGASAGDFFCAMVTPSGGTVREVTQAKYRERIGDLISAKDYDDEVMKAADPSDGFLLLTTGRCDLPAVASSRHGVVDANNYRDYFGLFASRVFLRAPNINMSPRSYLEGVFMIGPKKAALIVEKRPYSSLQDCANKTGIPINTINHFEWAP
jgi:hypothetical protein